MPFCANCGSQVDGKFCPKCGAAINAAAAPLGAPAPGGAPYASAAPAGLTDNVASALCYSLGFITGILFLVLEPYNRNPKIRFHAFQSIFYSVAFIALRMVFWMIALMSGGWLLLFPVIMLIGIGAFVLWLVLIIKAYQDQKLVLPVIGPMAQQQAGS